MAGEFDAESDQAFSCGPINSGNCILVAGPAMTGKRKLMYRLLADSSDGSAAYISTKHDADRMNKELSATSQVDDYTLHFIDCVSRQQSITIPEKSETCHYISSAGDLTGIGIALSGFMQDAYHDPAIDHAAIGLHTLSTMLMYADLQRVFQFVHVITGRIASSDFVGVFTLDTLNRTDESITRLKGLFDGLIEIQEDDQNPKYRTRGSIPGPRQWTDGYSDK